MCQYVTCIYEEVICFIAMLQVFMKKLYASCVNMLNVLMKKLYVL